MRNYASEASTPKAAGEQFAEGEAAGGAPGMGAEQRGEGHDVAKSSRVPERRETRTDRQGPRTGAPAHRPRRPERRGRVREGRSGGSRR